MQPEKLTDNRKIIFVVLLITGSLAVGLLYIAPQFFIGRALQTQNRPHLAVPYELHSDELIQYLPRGREVYDGHLLVSDLFSDKKLISPLPALPPLIISLPIFVSGGNVNLAYLIAQFVFSAAIFIAFYFLGNIVLKSRPWSFFLAFAATLTPLARDLPRGFFSLDNFSNKIFKNFIPIIKTQFDNLHLYRMDDPLITFLIYIPALIALFAFWQNPRKLTAFWVGGLIGLLVYTYLYYWVYLALILFLITIYAFLKRKEDPTRFRYLFISWSIFALFLIPYLVNLLNFTGLDLAKDWRSRTGAEEFGRRVYLAYTIPHYIFYAVSAALVYFIFWKREKRELAVLWWSSIAAMPILLNMQVITGFNVVTDHWFFAFSPLALVFILAVFSELTKKFNRRWAAAAVFILTALLVSKKAVNALSFVNPNPGILEVHTIDRSITDSWLWISKNIPGEPRIASNSFMTSIYLAAYTSARPYLPTFMNTYLTNQAVEDRVLQINKLFGVSPDFLATLFKVKGRDDMTCDEIKALFYKNPPLQCNVHTLDNLVNYFYPFYYYYFREKDYSTIGFLQPHLEIPEEKVLELLSRYKISLPRWQDLPIDYVYYGPFERELTGKGLEKYPELAKVYENGGVQIYKILRP